MLYSNTFPSFIDKKITGIGVCLSYDYGNLELIFKKVNDFAG